MHDLKITANTAELKSALAAHYEDYQKSWAATEVKWQVAVLAALENAANRSAKVTKDEATRPTETHEGANVPAKRLSRALARLGKEVSKVFNDRPHDYSDDYQQAIEMLEAHQSETIELSEDEFQVLMQDKWDWRGAWCRTVATINSYSAPGDVKRPEPGFPDHDPILD